jgi:hypothetical protein
MRNIFLGAAAIAVASIATPGVAQYQQSPNQNYSYAAPNGTLSWRIAQLQTRLQEGVRSGSITRREARPIRQQIERLSYLERTYTANGLTGQERSTLQRGIREIRQQLRRADDGAQGRYAEWDRDDNGNWGAPNNGSYAGRVDANNDGWDDRDYNRDGRPDGNYGYQQPDGYGYQQPGGYGYQQPGNYGYQQPAPATGIAGVLQGLLGGGTSLQVGHRAPANLYAVPYQYQAQYRDGNGVYYRSDGRNIYQIDARTQTIINIFRV